MNVFYLLKWRSFKGAVGSGKRVFKRVTVAYCAFSKKVNEHKSSTWMGHLSSILALGVWGRGGERGILKPNLCKFKCPWGSHQNVEASYFISQWPNIEQWSFNCKIFGSQVSCLGSVWKRYTSSFRGKGNLIVICIKVWNNDKLVIHGTEGWP